MAQIPIVIEKTISPKIINTQSNVNISFPFSDNLALYNLEIIIENSVVQNTISFYDKKGEFLSSITIIEPTKLKFKNVNYAQISLSDPNNYTITIYYQVFTYANEQDYYNAFKETETIQSPIISSYPDALALQFTTSSTANTITQISTDTTYREEITILASSQNSAPVLIGTSSNVVFPISPGASLTLKKTNLSLWYAQSSAASQVLYIIAGGGDRAGVPI